MSDFQIIEVENAGQLTQFCEASDLPVLNPDAVARQKADVHWMIVDAKGKINARCSLWWRDVPAYPGQRLGIMGHFAANSAEAADSLLKLAEKQLALQGCSLAVGPMDGNTWRSYRLVVERGSEPPFFLEPDNPDDWPAYFTENGYSIFSEYFSALIPDLGRQPSDLTKIAERIRQRGIQIRSFNSEHFDQELRQIYEVSLDSFDRNFLYTPIDLSDFMSTYQPIRAYIRPELILIAEHDEQAVGFLFALPDLFQTRRGEAVDTVIIKTVAVRPAYQMLGLGNLLVARCEAAAHELGYKRSIHALMHQTNASRKISQRHEAQRLRRYALFAKPL